MGRSSWIPGPATASCSEAGGGRELRDGLACWAAALAFLLITHWPYLGLPYYWDELGYFVPAAHDLLRSGQLVPYTTEPNAHPPLVSAYLAGAWKLFGFSPAVTRVAMLMVAAGTIAAAFLLARRLAGPRAGWAAAAMLAVAPPFVAQGMLAHLDLAAAMWALLATYWFVTGRLWWCVAAATALALTKETGIIVAVALAWFARAERKRAAAFLLPLAALAGWLVLLRAETGHWLGSAAFARYNVEALDAWRIPLVLARRLHQLGIANFHWVASGLIVLAVIRRGALRGKPWRLAGAVTASYVLLHSVVGGAILMRYLLPALALFYIAAAAALEEVGPWARRAALALLLAGLTVSNWWHPPYPAAYEDNLAVVDFVRLQQQAASWMSEHAGDRAITTAWPLTDALANPLLGYVPRALRVNPIENFQPPSWGGLDPARVEVVALYSRTWEPPGGVHRWPPLAGLLERRFRFRPQLPPDQVRRKFGLKSAARWERRGQWMEILVR